MRASEVDPVPGYAGGCRARYRTPATQEVWEREAASGHQCQGPRRCVGRPGGRPGAVPRRADAPLEPHCRRRGNISLRPKNTHSTATRTFHEIEAGFRKNRHELNSRMIMSGRSHCCFYQTVSKKYRDVASRGAVCRHAIARWRGWPGRRSGICVKSASPAGWRICGLDSHATGPSPIRRPGVRVGEGGVPGMKPATGGSGTEIA